MVPEAPNLTTYNKITNGLFAVGVCFPLTMFTHFLMLFTACLFINRLMGSVLGLGDSNIGPGSILFSREGAAKCLRLNLLFNVFAIWDMAV